MATHEVKANFAITAWQVFPVWKSPVWSDTKIHWVWVMLQTLTIHANIQFTSIITEVCEAMENLSWIMSLSKCIRQLRKRQKKIVIYRPNICIHNILLLIDCKQCFSLSDLSHIESYGQPVACTLSMIWSSNHWSPIMEQWHPITPLLFHSRLKTFLFCKSFLLSVAFLFFFRTDFMDCPECLQILLSISNFLVFLFFLFSTF